jgi:hypothetical protein
MSRTLIADMLNDHGFKGIHTMHGNRTSFRTMMPSTGDEFLGKIATLNGKAFDVALACEVQIDHSHGEEMKAATANMPGVYARGDLLDERRFIVQHWNDLIERLCATALPEDSGDLRIAQERTALGARIAPQLAA